MLQWGLVIFQEPKTLNWLKHNITTLGGSTPYNGDTETCLRIAMEVLYDRRYKAIAFLNEGRF
jgi:hypothetical protein